MIEFVKFLIVAARAYRLAEREGRAVYTTVEVFGVPKLVIFVASGRNAWQITRLAIESAAWKIKDVRPDMMHAKRLKIIQKKCEIR